MGGWDRSRWGYVTFMSVAAGLAWWTGYRNEVAVVTAAGKHPLSFRSAARQLLAPKSERDAIKQLGAIRQRAGRGALTPSETAECWQIIRNFSEKQLQDYLADLPRSEMDGTRVLIYMLFHRWAQLAPETAAREATRGPDKEDGFLVRYILSAWMSKDRDAAERWAEAQGSAHFKMISSLFMGQMLVREDPLTAPERAEKEHPAALPIVLRTMASQMGATAASRKDFLALQAKYGGREGWDSAVYVLAFAAASKDSENLLATLADTGLPPEHALEYRNVAVEQMRSQNPEKLMDWTMESASGVSAEKQASLYGDWAWYHSREATDWAVRNGRQDFIADELKKQGKDLAGSRWENWKGEGPQGGWAAAVVHRYQAWRAHDPAAAEAWAGTMPADIRNHLNGKTADVPK